MIGPRPSSARPKAGTVERQMVCGVQARREIAALLPEGGVVGIDMGVVRFATLSDGSHLDSLNSFKKHQQRLAKHQRRMARKVRFSSNWKKAKAKVTQVHSDIGNARQYFLHKVSTTISQNHAVVCVERFVDTEYVQVQQGQCRTVR